MELIIMRSKNWVQRLFNRRTNHEAKPGPAPAITNPLLVADLVKIFIIDLLRNRGYCSSGNSRL